MVPLTIEISTRDRGRQKEIRRQYIVRTRFPRWELIKIFWHILFHLRFH